jgi:hypothetical protein
VGLRTEKEDFKVHELPLARIKKIMKIEDEIKVSICLWHVRCPLLLVSIAD